MGNRITEWNKIRKRLFSGVKRECVKCGNTYSRLEFHHINLKGAKLGKKSWVDNGEDNLVLLCVKCHRAIHGRVQSAKAKKKAQRFVMKDYDYERLGS